jgi:hypothetical protein
MEEFYKTTTKIVVIMLATVVVVVFKGFLLAKFWGWFIIPVFNLPSLSITTAIGISMTAGLFTFTMPKENKYDEKSKYWLTESLSIIVMLLVVWYFGWLLTLFM